MSGDGPAPTPPPGSLPDAGRLADQAIACLARPQQATAHGRPVYSSDLSVDEAILLGESGFRPCRLVMGSSIFHVGWAGPSGGYVGLTAVRGGYAEGELEGLTRAMYDARVHATSRLLADAQAAGGDVVVGVRLTIRSHGRLAEFSAVGTAVARAEGGRTRPKPVATDLSGQDFYLLDRAGYEPVGLVFGNCVYYVPPNWASLSTTNVELDAPTRALTRARELAMGRLQREAEGLRAVGVVGVTATERAHAFWSGGTEFLAVGTAVRLKRGGEHLGVEVHPVVELEDALVTTDPGAITGRAAGGAAAQE